MISTGTPLALCSSMRTTATIADTTQSLLRWVFHQGQHDLTCAVHANSRGVYDVCVVRHWKLLSSIVEPFTSAASAFERHAEISMGLRRKGWVVVHAPLRNTTTA